MKFLTHVQRFLTLRYSKDPIILSQEDWISNAILSVQKLSSTFIENRHTQNRCFNHLLPVKCTDTCGILAINPIYDTKLSDFKDKLMRRGYERSEIDNCYRKLKFNDRKDILYGTKTKPNVQKLMFVTKYHPDSGKLTKAVNKHLNLIEKNTYLSTLFPHKIMVTFKKGKNIADMITRNKL